MSRYNVKTIVADLPENKKVNVDLLVITFIEESIYYYYSPQVDVYGYGQTDTEARESLETTLHEFFRYTLENGTLEQELLRLGWKLQSKTQSIKAPDFADLLSKNAEFQHIVASRSFTKKLHNIQMPAVA